MIEYYCFKSIFTISHSDFNQYFENITLICYIENPAIIHEYLLSHFVSVSDWKSTKRLQNVNPWKNYIHTGVTWRHHEVGGRTVSVSRPWPVGNCKWTGNENYINCCLIESVVYGRETKHWIKLHNKYCNAITLRTEGRKNCRGMKTRNKKFNIPAVKSNIHTSSK